MSNGTKGAASAVPAVPTNGTPAEADQWEADAIASIKTVSTPEDAETLLARVKVAEQAFAIGKLGADRERRWKQLRLRAERRYGELLKPPQTGGRREGHVTGSHVTPDERKTQERARKVAAVDPDEFNAYVENEPEPTRTGLLRKAGPPKQPPKSRQRTDAGALWEDDDALTWVAKRMKAGRSTYQIRDESKAGKHGWPFGPGTYLGQNASEKAVAVVRDRQRRGDTTRRPPPKESGKRLRELHAQKRAGRTQTDLWHLQVAVAKAVAVLEGFDLPDLDWSEYTEALVNEICDDLERHARWNDAATDAVIAHLDELGRERKLKLLRVVVDDPSSTPGERASAARLAERLERRRSAARLSS